MRRFRISRFGRSARMPELGDVLLSLSDSFQSAFSGPGPYFYRPTFAQLAPAPFTHQSSANVSSSSSILAFAPQVPLRPCPKTPWSFPVCRTPPIDLLSPDTPEVSPHSASTYPASSVSPQMPPDVHGSVCVCQGCLGGFEPSRGSHHPPWPQPQSERLRTGNSHSTRRALSGNGLGFPSGALFYFSVSLFQTFTLFKWTSVMLIYLSDLPPESNAALLSFGKVVCNIYVLITL
jgi:hypothetical protein